MRPSALLLVAGGLLSGCVATQPAVKDPYASLFADSAPAAYPRLDAAVIVSDNTKRAFQASKSAGWYPGLKDFADTTLAQQADLIIRNFHSAQKIERLSDAANLNVDVVVVMDLVVKYIRQEYAQKQFLVTTPDGRTVDTISADGRRSYFGCLNSLNCLREAAEDAQQKLGRALRDSKALHELDLAKAGGSAVAAQPAPREYHSDVDVPSYRAAEDPHSFAVVVGVEKYSGDLPPAQFAERDARSMREHLVALGVPDRNIRFLSGERATKGKLEGVLEEWLSRATDEDSKVFFYFSGHGAPDTASNQAYLVPWDADPNLLSKTAYPLQKLYDTLGSLKARQVTAMLDSCFSGAGARSVLAHGARPLVVKIESAVPPKGRLAVLAASAPTEITGALDDQGHGIFTYYLLKGLNDAGLKGGALTAENLFRSLKTKVQDAASRQNREQTPTLQGDGAQELGRLEQR